MKMMIVHSLSIDSEKSPCLRQGGYRHFPCSLSSLSWRLGGSGQGLSFLEEIGVSRLR